MFWKRYPLFRVFVAYATGVLLANFFTISWVVSFSALGISVFFVLAILLSKKQIGVFRFPFWQGASIQALFLFLGIVLSNIYAANWQPAFHKIPEQTQTEYLIQITAEPRLKERSLGMEAKLLAQNRFDSLQAAQGGLMLYLEQDSLAGELQYGDQLYITAQLNPLKPPANPYEFDYRNYLNLKGIYFQAYIPSEKWTKGENQGGFTLKRNALTKRRELMQIISDWNLSARGEAISNALLLGFRDDIDDEMMKAFSAAGAMHVLAVSGLHVGIIFLMAGKLLFFFDQNARSKILKSIILVLILWAYALLTGLSASVVRAATMFTFMALGTAFQRNTSIYNTIIVSALFLMLIKPTYLFEVGFQLSYAAVFGIVWMQPRFMKLIPIKTRAGEWFWGIVTVSIAAQIATFPLGLYYFHQFPSLFLISNILVIPLVTLLMYVGIFNLILSVFGVMPTFLLIAYEYLLLALTWSVNTVEGFSIFLINQIHINRLELVLFYGFILFFFHWLFSGRKFRLAAALGLVIILFGIQFWENAKLNKERNFTAYKINKQAAFGFYGTEEAYFLGDSSLLENDDALTFYVRHHWWAQNKARVNLCSWQDSLREATFQKSDNLICFEGFSFWLVKEAEPPLPASYWLVNYQWPPQSKTTPGQAIILSAVSKEQKIEWEKYADQNGIGLVSLPDSATAFQQHWFESFQD